VVGEQLHQFDLALAWYVLDNVLAHLAHAGFAAYVEEQVDPPILAYLKTLDGDVEPPALLLDDQELEDLRVTFHNGPFEFDRPWIVHERIHRLDVACAAEIRAALAPRYADEWARASAQFAERLEAAHVNLHDGIEIVAEWIREVRRLLRAMGATDLLPAPEGRIPTPTHPQPPTPIAAAPAAPTGQQGDQTLRAAVEEIRDLLVSQRAVQDWYTTEEAAQLLGKAEYTIREWCRRGRVRAEKKGSGRGKYQSWVISHAELLRIQREGLLPVKG
jgi:excisionase family DNA binding protein